MGAKALIKRHHLPIIMFLFVLGVIGWATQLETAKDETPGFMHGYIHGFCMRFSFGGL